MSRLVDIEPNEDCRIVLNAEDEGVRCRDLPTVDLAEEKHTTPCDLCVYNLPSSFGGKPCGYCPAQAAMPAL